MKNSKTILVLWPRYLTTQKYFFESLLKDERIDLVFVAEWKKNNAYNEKKDGYLELNSKRVTQWEFNEIRIGKLNIYESFKMLKQVFKTIQKGKYDLIITSTQYPLHSKLAFLCSKLLHKKIAFYTEAWVFNSPPGILKQLSFKTTRYMERKADFILTQSDHKSSIYQELGVKKSKTIFLPFLINDYALNSWGGKSKSKITKFFYLGRFIDLKGIDLLLEAFIKLSKSNAHIELYLAGDTKEKLLNLSSKYAFLFKEIEKMNISKNIHFLGFLNENEKKQILNQVDIFVIPSRENEGWGISLMEASQFGLICIATKNVASAKVFIEENKNGYIFNSDNTNELSNILETVINFNSNVYNDFSIHSRKLFLNYNNQENFLRILRTL